jgi:hypothetical protein
MGRYVDENGDVLGLLISPGEGASADYPEMVIARDAEAAFGGAHVFLDHPTVAESNARPERSVRDLIGGMVSTPGFLKEGPDGPGVYAKWHCFKPFRELIEEMGPFVGMSIRVPGEREAKVVEGKRRFVATKLLASPFNSVDIVTRGARGGKMIATESARVEALANAFRNPWADEWMMESDGRNEKDVAAFARWAIEREKMETQNKEREAMELREALERIRVLEEENKAKTAENVRLAEALALRDAKTIVESVVGAESVKLPDATKKRLVESLTTAAPLKEGKLDETTLRTMIAEAVATEEKYVGAILKEAGAGSRVRGMGDSEPLVKDPFREALYEQYLTEGMTPEAAGSMADRVARGGR